MDTKTNKTDLSFDEIVQSISFEDFKASFLLAEEKKLSDTLEKIANKETTPSKMEIILRGFLENIRKNLSDSDKAAVQSKAFDPLYNIAYYARAISQMHPGFSPEGQQAGFETEDFKSEVVKLYQKYQSENLKLTNEGKVNQLLTDLLGIGLTTLQDNHFNVRTSEDKRVYKDDKKTMAEWTQNGKRPLKTHHPEKGNVGQNVAYCADKLTKILMQENLGTKENQRPLLVAEHKIAGKTYGVVAMSSSVIHWRTPAQEEEERKFKKLSETFEKHYKNWDGVIIDVRGNGGGDATINKRITRMLSGEETPYCLMTTKRKTKEAELREIGSPSVSEQPRWEKKTFHGKHRVFLLADSKTCSSSEAFIPMLQHYEKATYIGENSNGCCQYGAIKPVHLPCGGIMNIGTLFRSYEDGMVECVGHKPDINCQGRDALQVAFEEIQKEEIGKEKKSLNDTLSNLSIKGGHFKKWLHSLRHKNKQK